LKFSAKDVLRKNTKTPSQRQTARVEMEEQNRKTIKLLPMPMKNLSMNKGLAAEADSWAN